MKIILDCTDADTALDSVAAAFSVSSSDVTMAMERVDLDALCELPGYDGEPNRALMRALAANLGRQPATTIGEVRWFHLTRVPRGTSFKEGILPLSLSLTKIWDTLSQVFDGSPRKERLRALREEGVMDFQYQHKVDKPALAGPYAMLVRESAFHASEMGNHDYLRLPEIVEDICNEYLARFAEDILPDLYVALVPCIVSFRASNYRLAYLEAAARYVYARHHGDSLSVYTNHIFDGANRVVPAEDILGVEYF